MGRLKTIMSHTRNINMEMNEKFIKYEIPIFLEKEMLGNICGFEIKSDSIVLSFINKNPPVKQEVKEVKSCCLPATINAHLAEKQEEFSLKFD